MKILVLFAKKWQRLFTAHYVGVTSLDPLRVSISRTIDQNMGLSHSIRFIMMWKVKKYMLINAVWTFFLSTDENRPKGPRQVDFRQRMQHCWYWVKIGHVSYDFALFLSTWIISSKEKSVLSNRAPKYLKKNQNGTFVLKEHCHFLVSDNSM